MGTFGEKRSHEMTVENEKEQSLSFDHDMAAVKLPDGARTNDRGVPTYLGFSGNTLIYMITATSCAAFSLFGYDQGIMSGILTAPQFTRTFPLVDEAIQGKTKAANMQAFFTSIYEIGCLAGAACALAFGNTLGRIRTIQLGAIIMILGVIIQVTAVKGHSATAQFLIGRTITGVGNGLNTATVPTWNSEASRSHNRGLLVCIEASTIAFGTMIAYWVDFGLSFVPNTTSWRVPIALQIIFAVFVLAGTAVFPESPRWYISKGRFAEGQRVVASLVDDDVTGAATQAQTRMIIDSIEQTAALGKPRISQLFTNGPSQNFRRMMIGALSQCFQQIGGCNAVIYYSSVIYEQNLRLPRQLSLILGGVNNTVYAMSAFLSFFLVERFGRRPMYLWGSLGQALSMILIFGCLVPKKESAYKGGVVGLFFFLIVFGCTWLELPWLTPAEINGLRTRTHANAVSTMSNWLFNFAVVQWTPPLLAAIDSYTFLFYAIINLSFIPIIYVLFPETAGLELEAIDEIFAIGYTQKKWYVRVADDLRTKYVHNKRNHLESGVETPAEEEETDSREGTVVEDNGVRPKKNAGTESA